MQNKPVVIKVFNGNPHQSGQFVGTAFFINSRYLLSAAHVCNACDKGIFLSELPKGGNLKIPADHVHFCNTSHGNRDVVIIEFPIDEETIPDLPLSTQTISENIAIQLYGYDHKDQPINELESLISGYVNSYHSWKMQGSIARGLSGGPVICDNRLLGIIYARDSDKNIAYCIPVDEIKKCLANITTEVQSSTKLAKLYGVPQLPAHYMLRESYLNSFRKTLLKSDISKVGITGRYVGVQGMGGIGKSILANALAHDEAVQKAFPDGIFWLQFRQQIDEDYLLERQKDILQSLQCEQVPDSLSQGKNLLDLTLQDKHCLLIIDDIWNTKHIKYFDINNTDSRYLLTTRNSALLADFGAITCPVDLLSEVDALNLLAIYSGYSFNDLPMESKEIVKECGFLPLAIAAIGSTVKNKPANRWKLALKKLKKADLKKISTTFDYDHNNLFKAFQVSVDALPKEVQEYYKTLVIFPEDVQIPESVLEVLWGHLDLGELDSLDVIDQLVEASLFARVDDEFLMLHDLLRDYLNTLVNDKVQLHQQFFDAYEVAYPDGWHTIPVKRPYYFNNYWTYHLDQLENLSKGREIADAMILQQPYFNLPQLRKALTFVDYQLIDIAPKLLKKSKNQGVQVACINVLGGEAKGDARRLLKESKSQDVLIACLNLLGDEAKEDAHRLIKESQNQHILTTCLNMLGDKVKDDARRLIKESQNQHILTTCLNTLGNEAKDDARRLFKDSQNEYVLTACFKILGNEIKDDALQLIKESNNQEVLSACLKFLGDEAKDDARRLIKESKNISLLTTCLKVLGNEAKNDARRLIKESQKSSLLAACLNVLGNDAKNDARRLIKESKDTYLLTACLNVLGNEAKDDARRLLKESKDRYVLTACLKILGGSAKDLKHFL